MGWENLPRDNKGHALRKDQQDGMECPHVSGASNDSSNNKQELNKEEKTLKRYCDRYEVDFNKAKEELQKRIKYSKEKLGYTSERDALNAALESLTDDIVMGDFDSNYDSDINNALEEELADNEYVYAGLSKEEAARIMKKRTKYSDRIIDEFIEKNFDESYWNEDDLENDPVSTMLKMEKEGINTSDLREVKQYLGANMGLDREDQDKFIKAIKDSGEFDLNWNEDDDLDINEESESSAEYNEKGKSTWNQKLSKGQKVVIKDKNGNDMEAYIGGFYKNQNLQNEDTYEEGKDNLWHDFRGIQLIDKNGKEIGNINANQIKRVENESDNTPQSNYNSYKNLINKMTTKGQKYDLIQDIKSDDSLSQKQKMELIFKVLDGPSTLNKDEERENISKVEGDKTFDIK